MSATETAWTVRRDGESEERFDVPPGRLVEDLPGGGVRVPTQETRIGEPAAAPAQERPNPMLSSHRAWLDGLIRAASGKLDA
ncbi:MULTISPECIES: hypothetical protein [Streptomyces]|uniref:hypothetical protein n=1 Tax=Streptomyces TaxID=1883 RepID=UPI003255AA00|nr:hypothetical protein OG806_04005 [Streptomyces sp. NBC_00882]WSZ55682.1 hypothetical protein OH824_03575 [Streptomyces canus]